jgi:hypothetical protein
LLLLTHFVLTLLQLHAVVIEQALLMLQLRLQPDMLVTQRPLRLLLSPPG